MESLFVYGTLRDADVQRRVFGRVTPGAADTLAGFRVDQIEIEGVAYPIAASEPGAHISGMVLALTADELARGDAYEGAEYRRFRVTLDSGREAWVYGV